MQADSATINKNTAAYPPELIKCCTRQSYAI